MSSTSEAPPKHDRNFTGISKGPAKTGSNFFSDNLQRSPVALGFYATEHSNFTDGPLVPHHIGDLDARQQVRELARWVESNLHELDELKLKSGGHDMPAKGDGGQEAEFMLKVRKLLPGPIVETIDKYEKGLTELHEEVTSEEAQKKLQKIAERYKRLDPYAIPENIQELRKTYRRRLVFDFDGTWSDPNGTTPDGKRYRVDSAGNDLKTDPLLAGSDPLDEYLGEGRARFNIAAAYWQEAMLDFPTVFEAGGKEVPYRAGMKELVEDLLADPNIDITIITTNFEPFMMGALSRISGYEKIQLYCVRKDNLQSAAKGDLVKKIALDNPDSILEYGGDSKSDDPATEAFSVVAAYHTVAGLSFDKEMARKGMAHLPFEDANQLGINLGVVLPQSK